MSNDGVLGRQDEATQPEIRLVHQDKLKSIFLTTEKRVLMQQHLLYLMRNNTYLFSSKA